MPALTVLPVAAALTVRPVAPAPPAPACTSAAFCATDRGASSLSNSAVTTNACAAAGSRDRVVTKLHLAEGARWVLFKGNDVIVRANSDDEDEARRARRSFSGDLLWFKLDGKAYVSQDRETMNRVEAASSSTVALESTIRQLATSRRNENDQEQMVSAQVG